MVVGTKGDGRMGRESWGRSAGRPSLGKRAKEEEEEEKKKRTRDRDAI